MNDILVTFLGRLVLMLAFFGIVHLMLRSHNQYEMQKLERKAEELKLMMDIEWDCLKKKYDSK